MDTQLSATSNSALPDLLAPAVRVTEVIRRILT